MKIIKVKCGDAKEVLLKTLKKRDFFTLKPIEEPKESQVWVLDEYDRSEKKYFAHKFSDVNHSKLFKPTQKVFVDFYF